MMVTLAEELGLYFGSSFVGDRQFYAALIAGPLTVTLLHRYLPVRGSGPAIVLFLVLWSPLLEELLFRGVIQGQLARRAWARCKVSGISVANMATSAGFALAHLLHHPPPWAAATAVPSLVFGYFRERHRQVYPAMVLHAAYNGCYLAAAAWNLDNGSFSFPSLP